jgi:membrane-associated phospholipid phosphatase
MGHSEQHRADTSRKAAQATADRHPVEQADAQAVAAVAPLRDAWPVRAASALSEIADQPPLVALSATVAIAGLATRNARLARAGGRMLSAHALATLGKKIIKDNVDRSRPQKLVDAGEYRMESGDSADGDLRSFPSGHTAGGVAVVRALTREYPGSAWPAGLAMTAIAAALVPKQAHYPSDVAAGAAIGWLAEAIVDFGWERLERHLPNGFATR